MAGAIFQGIVVKFKWFLPARQGEFVKNCKKGDPILGAMVRLGAQPLLTIPPFGDLAHWRPRGDSGRRDPD